MATSTSLNTPTSAGACTQSHWLSSLGKEMGFQPRSRRLNGVLFLDALREDIPEGGGDISEGSLAVPLCLGIPGPGNIEERSRCWSEKARWVVFLEKKREVEGGVIMNWLVCGRENFVAWRGLACCKSYGKHSVNEIVWNTMHLTRLGKGGMTTGK